MTTLESTFEFEELKTELDFERALKFDKAIFYILVDWSGPERISRNIVCEAISSLNITDMPVFKIDCSDPMETKQYVVDWLINQRENYENFYVGGWGETLLVANGKIVDFIRYPGHLGLKKTKEKIDEWKTIP